MKTKLIFFWLLIIAGCCKNQMPESDDPLMGTWSIIQVDSLFTQWPLRQELTQNLGKVNYQGSISFYPDSTGEIYGSVTTLTDGMNSFVWGYDTTEMPAVKLGMGFVSGWTKAYVDSLSDDSMILWMKDFYHAPNTYGGHYYYRFYLRSN